MSNYIQFESFLIIPVDQLRCSYSIVDLIKTIELNNLTKKCIKFYSNLVYYLLNAYTLIWTLFTLKLIQLQNWIN